MKKSSSLFDTLRRLRISATLAAIVYLALGVALIVAPEAARGVLCLIISLGVLAYGALNVVTFLLSREDGVYAFDLFIGVCALAFGIFSLVNRTFLLNFLFIVLGLTGVVGSVSNIRRAMNLRAVGYPKWAIPLAPGVAALLISISVVFWPDLYGNLMMIVLGVLLIVEGASDLFSLHELSQLAKM